MAENKPILGELLKGEEERDAIHIAILPATAGDYIAPGERIYVKPDGWATRTGERNAIADPFLSHQIYPGQKFYALLFPYTIESLRHEWVHKDFPKPENTAPISSSNPAIQGSINWMTDLANEYASYQYDNRHDLSPYEWLMKEADSIVNGDESYIVFNVDCHGDIDPQEFWRHYQTIRRVIVALDTAEDIFTCSC